MVFSSEVFLFYFLPLVLGVYYLLLRAPNVTRMAWLTVMSYVFYGWWRVDFTLLMAISTVIDWFCGRMVGREGDVRRKPWVLLSVVTNLGLLGYFKYANFGIENFNRIAASIGVDPVQDWVDVVLPVGISFYTFQSMSYTIDIYRGQAKPVKSFLELSAYVSLFPQLVAGPIVRYGSIHEQLHERSHTLDKLGTGARLFMIGFAKKMILADGVGLIADEVFGRGEPGFFQAWLGALAYAMQIYYDFSGYSDMAIGLGLLFGFSFPCNFNSPYKSISITDFWRRWHMSLSSWLRDYLYIPLGGNRKGRARTYVNLAITMLLGGLWHGAQWTFVIWGAYHGILLALERLTGGGFLRRAPRPLQILGTFVIVLFGWVIFRAPDLETAAAMYSGMLGLNGLGEVMDGYWTTNALQWLQLGAGIVLAFFFRNSWQMTHERSSRLLDVAWVVPAFAAGLVLLFTANHVPFLYFQF